MRYNRIGVWEGRRVGDEGGRSREVWRVGVVSLRYILSFFSDPPILRSSLLLFLVTLPCHASLSQLKEGNRAFWNGHYEEALKSYNEAMVDAPTSSVLHFNAGAALYQMGQPEKAEKEMTEATHAANPILRGAAFYNLGNALMRERRWTDAIASYKDSLRANPSDEDAKYNLGVAMQAQKNPPPQPSGGSSDDKNQDKEKEKKKSEAAAQRQKDQMSPEDAERLLSAAGSGEKRKNAKAPKTKLPETDEDW